MNAAVLTSTSLLPPVERRWIGPLLLALVAHALLVAGLTWGISWNKDTPVHVVAQAELWSALPKLAAPREVDEAPAPPTEAESPAPPRRSSPHHPRPCQPNLPCPRPRSAQRNWKPRPRPTLRWPSKRRNKRRLKRPACWLNSKPKTKPASGPNNWPANANYRTASWPQSVKQPLKPS
jgi:hypothetical protein